VVRALPGVEHRARDDRCEMHVSVPEWVLSCFSHRSSTRACGLVSVVESSVGRELAGLARSSTAIALVGQRSAAAGPPPPHGGHHRERGWACRALRAAVRRGPGGRTTDGVVALRAARLASRTCVRALTSGSGRLSCGHRRSRVRGPQDSCVGARQGRSRRERACPRVGDGRRRNHGVRSFCPPGHPRHGRGRGERVDCTGGRHRGASGVGCGVSGRRAEPRLA
jgi:hypothetical protein